MVISLLKVEASFSGSSMMTLPFHSGLVNSHRLLTGQDLFNSELYASMVVPKREMSRGLVSSSGTFSPVGTNRQAYSLGSTVPTTSAPPLLNQTSPTNNPDSCSPT